MIDQNVLFNWDISGLECYTEESGYPNVVFLVHWVLTGKKVVDEVEYSSSCRGSTKLKNISGTTFVSYENLTQDIVVDWIVNTIPDDITNYKTGISENISSQITPRTVFLPIPW